MNPNNTVILNGRIYNLKVGATSNGKDVADFTIMLTKKINDEYVNSFVPCKAFGNTAQFIDKFFKEGQAVAIGGELNPYKYTNKDGKDISGMNVLVDKVTFLPKDKVKDEPSTDEKELIQQGFEMITDDDMPF